ncbi:Rieske (2Fe-2S) protein [Flavobacterium sp.]|uniref:Rieske (2Fe-2S) protein n=1 Tax=Flavobacterium sp. TaxID=239 RepID=UPI003BDFCACA
MKKILFLIFLSGLLFGCSKDKFNNTNPFLPNYNFSIDVNKNLPSYSGLNFTGNAVKAYPAKGPSRGIIIFNAGGTYNAWDGACPNQDLTTCSTLILSGSNANCACGNENYNLFTGQSTGKQYSLKQYRVEINGDIIRVYN